MPSGERAVRAAACSRSGRRSTRCSTRSTGCSCRAPTSPPTPWSPGLQDLGWEVDDVTAYRTVRAAPPPAEVREAIKTGQFDAVVFTSSSTVRNLVGIAGKPHATTVVACIGPATAKTAEEHGLRVDVLAPEPSAEALVAGARRVRDGAAAVRASRPGEPVLRPSQRKGADPADREVSGRGVSSGGAGRPAAAAADDARRCAGSWPRPGCTRPSWCCRCSSRRARASRSPITSMPGVVQHTRDTLRKAGRRGGRAGARRDHALRGPRRARTPSGSGATDPDGDPQRGGPRRRRRGRRRRSS